MATHSASDERRQRFSALFDAFHTKILVYARRRLPPDIAEDAVADTFLIAWKTLDSLDGEPLLWLYGIARRCVFNQRRTIGRTARLQTLLTFDRQAEIPDHGEIMGWEAPIVAALRQLKESDREVLRLVAWEQLSTTQGATVLGCSATTFKVRLHRARRRLRALLDTDDLAPKLETGRSSVMSTGHPTALPTCSTTTFDPHSLLPREHS